jgi:hypothetical protein
MSNEVIQVRADEDGCVYICDLTTKTWKKVCDIVKIDDLPASVRQKLCIVQESVDALHIYRQDSFAGTVRYIMGDFGKVVQLKSEVDDCVYICNLLTGKWQKLCDIATPDDMPYDIKEQVAVIQKSMDELCRSHNRR